MDVKLFGMHDNRPISSYTLRNANGMCMELISFGARIKSLFVPDRAGNAEDIVLGYDTLEEYVQDQAYLGAAVGRVANRLRDAKFMLGGKTYELAKNNGVNHLHGGPTGFHCRHFAGTELGDGVSFTRYSPNGEEGYPGNLTVNITYRLTDENALHIEYTACTDKDTLVNLTNHSYFNLAGHKSGNIYDQQLKINAEFYAPVREDCLPTGEIRAVQDTPMDFRSSKPFGRDIHSDFLQLRQFSGFDHTYVPNAGAKPRREIAVAFDPKSGRRMRTFSDLPGVQLYTANAMDIKGKDGAHYGKHSAFCLETQYFPNAINSSYFLRPVLEAGKVFYSTTIYQFDWS